MKKYETLRDINGIFMIADDMLITGKDKHEHNEILKEVFQKAKQMNIKLNKDKIWFKVSSVRYMGNIILDEGMNPDTEKVATILKMPDPENKPRIQRLLTTVNFFCH